jgi:FkbM family methyltransferase
MGSRLLKRLWRAISRRGISALRRQGYDVVRYYGPDEKVTLCRIVATTINQIPVSFFVMHDRDHIQRQHLQGRFYEIEELEIIGAHLRPGSVFLDVGANVGNHSLYAVRVLGASKAIAVEPNPTAYRILFANAAINDLGERLVHHPVGLCDAPARGSLRNADSLFNLGSATLDIDAEGPVPLIRGDDLLAGEHVDFIKIDVEGMELGVLSGLAETIARDRPGLFVEVENANYAPVAAFLEAQRFRIVERYRRYPSSENILALPVEARDQVSRGDLAGEEPLPEISFSKTATGLSGAPKAALT